MLALLFFVSLFVNGYIITRLLMSQLRGVLAVVSAYVCGMLYSYTLLYIAANILHSLISALIFYAAISIIFYLWLLIGKKVHIRISTKNMITERNIFFLLIIFILSYILFQRSFSYEHGKFFIASNIYLDFGAHIPIIRSFSLGNNFPSEVPFFANSGLMYHFIFDFSIGVLEALGLRIDIAYNLQSAFSFTCVCILIYTFGKYFTNSRSVGILSCILFLFPSTFAFISFIKKNGLSLSAIYHNNFYIGNYPFEQDLISGFWNMNTYLNQRQLVFGIAALLLFSLVLYKSNAKKRYVYVGIGVLIGMLPLWHMTSFIALLIICFGIGCFNKHRRFNIILVGISATILALPSIAMILLKSNNHLIFQPGFLIDLVKYPVIWLQFWWENLGVGLVCVAIGVYLASREMRHFFLILLPLFLIPNIIHISSRFPFDDHKFFNIWIIFMNIFSSLFSVWLFKRSILERMLAISIVSIMLFSGIINIFVIKNDVKTVITDYPKNNFLLWSKDHISSNSTVLTNGEIYDPLSIIGKKIFIGRAQYIYVYGGNPFERVEIKKEIFTSKNPHQVRSLLIENKIDYVAIYKENFAKNSINANNNVLSSFMKKVYEDKDGIVYIFNKSYLLH